MYKDFFGFQCFPFQEGLDVNFYFERGDRASILYRMQYVLGQGEGVVKLVGEPGVGKSYLCCILERQLQDQMRVVRIQAPCLTAGQLLQILQPHIYTIVSDNPVMPTGLLQTTKNIFAILESLKCQQWSQSQPAKPILLILDESQGVSCEVLELCRLLTNFEINHQKLFRLLLSGQPSLDHKLKNPRLASLQQRISQHLYLPSYTMEESYLYLNHRTRCAGYRGADLFPEKVSKKIARDSKGISRAINRLADKTLQSAFFYKTLNLEKKHVSHGQVDQKSSQLPIWCRPWRIISREASSYRQKP